jgi:hypothetical protein
LLILGAVAFTVSAADVSGKYSGTFAPEDGESSGAYVVLKQNGAAITGSAGPSASEQWPIITGKIAGNRITFEVKSGEDGTLYKADLVVSGDSLKGAVTGTRAEGAPLKAKLDVARVK